MSDPRLKIIGAQILSIMNTKVMAKASVTDDQIIFDKCFVTRPTCQATCPHPSDRTEVIDRHVPNLQDETRQASFFPSRLTNSLLSFPLSLLSDSGACSLMRQHLFPCCRVSHAHISLSTSPSLSPFFLACLQTLTSPSKYDTDAFTRSPNSFGSLCPIIILSSLRDLRACSFSKF